MRNTKIFAGSSHPELGALIAERLGTTLAPVKLTKFSNKETSVEIGCSVRNEDVFIVQSGGFSVNDHLMELFIMVSACKGASARRITAVVPYFPYSKQSKKKAYRSSITAKLVANVLSVAGVDHVITMDLHASQMQGFFNKPVDNLFAEPNIARWIQQNVPGYEQGVVVSKNPGGAKRVTSLADRLKIDFALIHKERTRPGTNGMKRTQSVARMTEMDGEELMEDESVSADVSVVCNENGEQTSITLVGDANGKIAFIVDDMIDECHSFLNAADHLVTKCKAKKVYIIATHALLSGNSVDAIEACQNVHQVVVTNTFPIPAEKRARSSKLTVIDVSGVLAEAIRRTHNGESISYLFDAVV
ncbi:uncharacterized protein VTP21DRAFT_11188 [Calcarisporiella thermophila]|uniref:uncharacterized protein n=1 Tax=Calcarisporiella thermophila TaxID=911321 RepID=UPI003742939F